MLNRRQFAQAIGLDALIVGAVGHAGAGRVWRDLWGAEEGRLDFGRHEHLAALMQDTEPERLLPIVIERLKSGVTLKDVVAAAALANARTFGGEDYVGYHCMMALLPALEMASFTKDRESWLPVLKVVYRNTARIRERGGRKDEKMRPIEATAPPADSAAALVAAERAGDSARAVAIMAGVVKSDPAAAFAALQHVVRENMDVHQVVLAWRAYDMIRIAGPEAAETMMVQALRQCVDREKSRVAQNRPEPAIREELRRWSAGGAGASLPKLAAAEVSDAQIESLAESCFSASSAEAMAAVAGALAEGVGTAAIGEALTLAGVRLLLHDPGRKTPSSGAGAGTVHGASVGVHAADAANAWRHIAAACPAEAAPTLLAGAWHTGGQVRQVVTSAPFHGGARPQAAKVAEADVIDAIDRAVGAGDQALAAALGERFGTLGVESTALFKRLATYCLDDDGALHHEKFFHTAHEESRTCRIAFRPHWLAALCRVAASGRGTEAPGVAAARRLVSG